MFYNGSIRVACHHVCPDVHLDAPNVKSSPQIHIAFFSGLYNLYPMRPQGRNSCCAVYNCLLGEPSWGELALSEPSSWGELAPTEPSSSRELALLLYEKL